MRSIRLDVKAVDAAGKIYDIQIQRSDRGTGARRARFYSSMIDRELLEKSRNFDELVDTYVIFITGKDRFGKGLPLYHIERRIAERVKYFKEEKRAKAEHNKVVEIAFEMISDGELLLQKIAQYSGLSIEEVKALASGKTA